MKYLSFVLAFLLYLQTATAQTKFAVKAGWNLTTAYVSDNGIKQPAKFKNGFSIALLSKIPFDHALHFSPYLGYNLRGFTYKPLAGFISKYEYTMHYIDLVPALSFDIPVNKKNTVVFSLGPQFGIALSGKEKVTAINNTSFSRKMKFSTDGDFGRVDVGLSSSIGYHMKKIFVELGYQLGLANINNNVDIVDYNTGIPIDPRNMRHRVISLNVGYYLK